MRLRAKIDSNQGEIVSKLRELGFSVHSTAAVGKGYPDIICGFTSQKHNIKINILFEIKDGNKPPSARKLTPDEIEWHSAWRGQVDVINSFDDAMNIINQYQ